MKALSFGRRFAFGRLAWVLIRFEVPEEVRITSRTMLVKPLPVKVEGVAIV